MAPRKKSKGKKPPETMRQRQMRLRKMQEQLKRSKKQLPPGKKGGAIVKSGPSKLMSPRLKAALDKKQRQLKARLVAPEQPVAEVCLSKHHVFLPVSHGFNVLFTAKIFKPLKTLLNKAVKKVLLLLNSL